MLPVYLYHAVSQLFITCLPFCNILDNDSSKKVCPGLISLLHHFFNLLYLFFVTKRDPVRLCNFHTVVIWGFLLTEGPFQLKWWLWLLYCSFLVALVFVPPKNGGFGYGAPHLPEKNLLKTEKNQGKQKHTHKKKHTPLEEILRYNISPQTLIFLFFLLFGKPKTTIFYWSKEI